MKPYPISNNLVCSECGLGWSLHPDKPRRRDCIKLLKENIRNRAYPYITYTNTYPVIPKSPWWGTVTTVENTTFQNTRSDNTSDTLVLN